MPTSATDETRGNHVLAPIAALHIVVVPVVEITEKLTALDDLSVPEIKHIFTGVMTIVNHSIYFIMYLATMPVRI